LSLSVGDAVIIIRECDNWYYGYKKYEGKYGIFPKSYICLRQKRTNMEALMNEITSVLREWGYYWKHLYVVRISHHSRYMILRRFIRLHMYIRRTYMRHTCVHPNFNLHFFYFLFFSSFLSFYSFYLDTFKAFWYHPTTNPRTHIVQKQNFKWYIDS
jgi:hypothetical protein